MRTHKNAFSTEETKMELRNLITFIHVAELGSFTRAAEYLGYSQSTISFQIKQLEDEIGCLLFERINHTIKLTERGHELVSYAHKVRALTEEFKESLVSEEEYRGNIRIVTPDSICEEMISSYYMEFHRRHPYISVCFSTGDSGVMLDKLDHNEVDFIITLDRRIYNKDYVIAKEQKLRMNFVASPRSRFAHAKNLSVADIINEPFALTENGQGYRRVFDRELAKKSLEINPVLEIGRTDIITSVVGQSNMISYLPEFVTRELVKAGKLCYLDVCDISTDIWKQLIYHKNKWLSGSMKVFLEYVKETEFTE